jgi:hypothetical protein
MWGICEDDTVIGGSLYDGGFRKWREVTTLGVRWR